MIADAIQPLLLFVRELFASGYRCKSPMHSLRSCEKWFLLTRCMLDHRDDIDEGLVVPHLVRFLKVINREPLISSTQFFAQLIEGFCAPASGTIEQDLNRLNVGGVLLHEAAKRREVVFRFVFLAVEAAHQPG